LCGAGVVLPCLVTDAPNSLSSTLSGGVITDGRMAVSQELESREEERRMGRRIVVHIFPHARHKHF
jgi:hypothetical protein